MKFLSLILILCLAIGGFWVWNNVLHKYSDLSNIDSRGKNIIAFGDSLTNGYGVGREKVYPAILEKEIGQPVINMGKNGDTTRSALERIDKDVLAQDPWIVIVYLGGNDVLQKFQQEETFSNLLKIIEKIHAKGAMVLLVGIRGPGIVTDPYKVPFEELAKKYKTAYVSDMIAGLLGHEDLMHDPIHPNEKGQQIIAEKILKVLRPLIKETEKLRKSPSSV